MIFIKMKYIKKFEGFSFKKMFSKDKDKPKEEGGKGYRFGFPIRETDSKILIDRDPYDKSQFGQNKYGVYIATNDLTLPIRVHYYIGDIREFEDSPGKYISYLDIERFIEKEPTGNVCDPNVEQMEIINKELDKTYQSRNLMDDSITFRELLKQRGIL